MVTMKGEVGADFDAGREWFGAVRHASSSKLHPAEFLHYNATPVCRRTCRFEPAFALSSVLIAEYSQLPLSVATQSVRTKQPMAFVITGFDWAPARNGTPNQSVDIFNRLDLRPNNAHTPSQ